jgi:phosphoglycolate phosphatase
VKGGSGLLSRCDTVIFDLDGTLLDTIDDLTGSLNHALKRHGFPERTAAEAKRFIGNGASRLVELSIPGGLANPLFAACLSTFRDHYAENTQNTRPYPGIMELLSRLSERGFRLAIVSNKPDAAVKELSRTWFGALIDVAIGESDGIRRKPDPAMVDAALKQMHAEPSRCAYVGDSEVDVQTARNAGMPCIGVTWGYRDRDTLIQSGADVLVDTPGELADVLGLRQ